MPKVACWDVGKGEEMLAGTQDADVGLWGLFALV
jgi:hypothetical protein